MKLFCLWFFIAATTAAVAEIKVATKYLPPQEKTVSDGAVVEPEVTEATAVLGDNGYQYKTVRRLRYRHRRDVSEVAQEYLPPVEGNVEKDYLPPSEEEIATEAAVVPEAMQDTAVLADDGYRYKTVRRLKYRQRREVADMYLPPAKEPVTESTEVSDGQQDTAVLGEDGYQYKTVRRLKYRHRRDVSEIPNEYLPPAENAVENEYLPPSVEAVTEAVATPETAQDTAILTDDGYRYKTVRRLKYRQRRDISEIAPQYLPPSEETTTESAEEADVPQDTAVLGVDGYQYKTVRRLKYRHRRDVSEISDEYLPPAENSIENEYLPPSVEVVTEAVEIPEIAQDTAVLADDGYRYKTVRRLKYRQRRDVSEISNEYLPPVEEVTTKAVEIPEITQNTAVLGEDGYHYKTVRRLKYRQRRDVSEIVEPNNDYLPPSAAAVIDIPVLPENALELEQDTAVLKEDGYHYKQHAEALNLAPAFDAPIVDDDTVVIDSPVESATLNKEANYRRRTIKRAKY